MQNTKEQNLEKKISELGGIGKPQGTRGVVIQLNYSLISELKVRVNFGFLERLLGGCRDDSLFQSAK